MKRPCDHELERAVVGVSLAYAERLREFRALLTDQDFDSQQWRAVWQAMGRVDATGADVDVIGVEREMRRDDTLGLIGGATGLMDLVEQRANVGNIPLHAKALRSLTRARRMHSALCDAMDAWDEEDPDGWVHSVAGKVSDVSRGEIASRPTWSRQIDDMLEGVMAEVDGRVIRIDTPWSDVNAAMNGGMEPGQLIVIAARPGLGKSALGLGVAMHVAEHRGHAFYWNREMTARGQIRRAIAQRARIGMAKAGGRGASSTEVSKIIATANALRSARMTVVDDVQQLEAGVSVMLDWRRRFDGPGLAVVDYLQLVGTDAENRTQEVGRVARGLKDAAMRMGVPMIALAQINRAGDTDPSMAHLRESGDIEAAADAIGILHRPKNPDSGKEIEGVVELFFDKGRDYARSRVRLAWLGDFVTFADCENRRQYQ